MIHEKAFEILAAIGVACSLPIIHANSWHTLCATAGMVGTGMTMTFAWDRAPAAGKRDCLRVSYGY